MITKLSVFSIFILQLIISSRFYVVSVTIENAAWQSFDFLWHRLSEVNFNQNSWAGTTSYYPNMMNSYTKYIDSILTCDENCQSQEIIKNSNYSGNFWLTSALCLDKCFKTNLGLNTTNQFTTNFHPDIYQIIKINQTASDYAQYAYSTIGGKNNNEMAVKSAYLYYLYNPLNYAAIDNLRYYNGYNARKDGDDRYVDLIKFRDIENSPFGYSKKINYLHDLVGKLKQKYPKIDVKFYPRNTNQQNYAMKFYFEKYFDQLTGAGLTIPEIYFNEENRFYQTLLTAIANYNYQNQGSTKIGQNLAEVLDQWQNAYDVCRSKCSLQAYQIKALNYGYGYNDPPPDLTDFEQFLVDFYSQIISCKNNCLKGIGISDPVLLRLALKNRFFHQKIITLSMNKSDYVKLEEMTFEMTDDARKFLKFVLRFMHEITREPNQKQEIENTIKLLDGEIKLPLDLENDEMLVDQDILKILEDHQREKILVEKVSGLAQFIMGENKQMSQA